MKIAILTPTFHKFSGIDRLVELQSKKLIKKGNKVDIFALRSSINPEKAGLYILGMPKNPITERLYRLFMFFDIKKINKYANILKNYDIIISHLYPMNILAYKVKKKNRKIKYIYCNAGVGITDTYSFFEKLYLKLFNFLNNKTIKNCDSAISISNFLRKELKKETGIDSRVEYIPIDKKRFHKGIDQNRIRRKYNIKDEPVFLYVGRISPHKGIHILIKAFKLLQKEKPKSKLIIAGKPTFPSYSKKLKKIADKNVIFAGFVSDEELPYYYAACDIYTTASLWEGFDMPVCLPPGSKIKLNPSDKDIEVINPNDKVLTHNHNYKKVIKRTKRAYKGPLIDICCFGYGQPLRLTPEHKIYCIQTKKCKKTKICKPIWVEAKDIKKGDLLVLPYKNRVKDKNSIIISNYVQDSKFIYNMVRKTERTDYSGFVYNLEVAGDKSYCTSIAAVHNCEAHACGKPTVAFDVGSHKEVLKKGILVKEKNPESLSKALMILLKKLKK